MGSQNQQGKSHLAKASVSHSGLEIGDKLGLLTIFLVPVPGFLGDWVLRGADFVRVLAITGRLASRGSACWGTHYVRVFCILLAMLSFAVVSMLRGVSQTPRDILDVARFGVFLLLFSYGASLATRSQLRRSCLIGAMQVFLMIGVSNAVFTAAQVVSPSASRPLQQMYSSDESRHIAMLGEQGRAFGFFSNPNTNAVMLLLLSLSALPLLQWTGHKVYLVAGGFVFSCVVMTGSRTGLFLAAAIITTVCVGSRKISYLIALLIIGWVGVVGLDYLVVSGTAKVVFPYLSELLIKVHASLNGAEFDVESINSFRARIDFWDEAFTYFWKEPVFGAGPLRDQLYSFSDNYFVYILSRYGLVGFGCYVAYNMYVAWVCLLGIMGRSSLMKSLGVVVLSSLVAVNIANYTMDAFPIIPIASVCLIYSGYLIGISDLLSTSASCGELVNSGKSKLQWQKR